MYVNVLETLLNANLAHLEGWKNAEMPPDVGPAPVLVASDFKATIPTASGALAPRQDWLDSLRVKLGHPASEAWSGLTKVIAQHNAHYNKSGRVYNGNGKREIDDTPEKKYYMYVCFMLVKAIPTGHLVRLGCIDWLQLLHLNWGRNAKRV